MDTKKISRNYTKKGKTDAEIASIMNVSRQLIQVNRKKARI